ncbi:hypothetical protein ACQW02_02910 [Humitalea sp. 24SJ18S-53]|uniref:hypothetical protein n=1 Tax=Humitalea sp. 24SJ18S-53 TaxID=3422307 RepID=UPI003D666964
MTIRSAPQGRRASLLALSTFALAGCAVVEKPGPGSIAGMSPVGTIQLDETVAVGATEGAGTLNFQGRAHRFKLVGGVTGGGGASSTNDSGSVYNLRTLADFAGLYTQSSGRPGLAESGASDLWLRNTSGVVLHLTGTQSGTLLSLGRQEILIEML